MHIVGLLIAFLSYVIAGLSGAYFFRMAAREIQASTRLRIASEYAYARDVYSGAILLVLLNIGWVTLLMVLGTDALHRL